MLTHMSVAHISKPIFCMPAVSSLTDTLMSSHKLTHVQAHLPPHAWWNAYEDVRGTPLARVLHHDSCRALTAYHTANCAVWQVGSAIRAPEENKSLSTNPAHICLTDPQIHQNLTYA